MTNWLFELAQSVLPSLIILRALELLPNALLATAAAFGNNIGNTSFVIQHDDGGGDY